MIIGKVLAQRAIISPDRTAMISGDKRITYAQLNKRANKMANALMKTGVSPGDRIGVLMHNCNEFIESYFAVVKIGAVLVPLNIRLAPNEFDYILEDCGVSIFLFGSAFDDKVDEMASFSHMSVCIAVGGSVLDDVQDYEEFIAKADDAEPDVSVNEEDLHVIMYTSGTTGYPKGAMLTHANMYSAGIDLLISLHLQFPDKWLVLAPFFHSGSITPFIAGVIRGVTTVIMETFEPVGALRLIEKEKIKHVLGVTAIMQMILREPDLDTYDLKSWAMAFLPGSPLPYEVIKEADDRLGILCQNLWGLTEMCGPGSIMNVEDILKKPGSAGKPYFNVDIRILGVDNTELPPGEIGEIVVSCPHMMIGYWNRPEETKKTIRDGWLYTGDSGTLDEDGFLYVIDRIKDMIVSGGENVYPAEIERVIREIPGGLDVAVIGIPDGKWGEVPKAFIEKPSGLDITSDDIIRYCRSKLAGYKVPKVIEFIRELPRNPSGKLLKKDLRKQLK